MIFSPVVHNSIIALFFRVQAVPFSPVKGVDTDIKLHHNKNKHSNTILRGKKVCRE